MKRRNRRVKVIATLGPSSDSKEMISRLFDCGADTFRINMSHTSHEMLRNIHSRIRKVEEDKGHPIGILVDLQGPKLRIGEFEDGKVELKKGAEFSLDSNDNPGNQDRVLLPHKEIFAAVNPGDKLMLDDGRIILKVKNVFSDSKQNILTEVEVGGILSNRKGVNLPDTIIDFGSMSPKDKSDLNCALEIGVDWIALSFIQRPEDIAEARTISKGRAAIMAKIEKPSAIHYLNEILEFSDGLMVARGDLGVELPIEQVPGKQKQIIRAARQAGKPVVVATQMLESMIESPVPTRAEVSDVATAVFDGADAIMLSAESAAGKYPDKSVAMMDQVAQEVEKDTLYEKILSAPNVMPEPTNADAISAAAKSVADTLNLAAIVCYTSSGTTGLRAARERPNKPIIALTPVSNTGRRLALVWGLHCVVSEDAKDLDDMVDKACRIAFQEGIAKSGQRVIISAGIPFGTPGATNMLRIAYVGENVDY